MGEILEFNANIKNERYIIVCTSFVKGCYEPLEKKKICNIKGLQNAINKSMALRFDSIQDNLMKDNPIEKIFIVIEEKDLARYFKCELEAGEIVFADTRTDDEILQSI